MKIYNYKIKGVPYEVKIKEVEGTIAKVEVNGIDFDVELEKPVAEPKPVVRAVAAPVKTVEPTKTQQESIEAGVYALRSPLPGTVNDIKVNVGDEVKVGQTLIVLEAMKMENNLDAERAGKVTAVKVQKGEAVPEGAVLITIE